MNMDRLVTYGHLLAMHTLSQQAGASVGSNELHVDVSVVPMSAPLANLTWHWSQPSDSARVSSIIDQCKRENSDAYAHAVASKTRRCTKSILLIKMYSTFWTNHEDQMRFTLRRTTLDGGQHGLMGRRRFQYDPKISIQNWPIFDSDCDMKSAVNINV